MIILDTSVWIEHFKGNQNFYPRISNWLESRKVLAIECIFGELLQGAKNDREKTIITNFWKYLPKENYEDITIEAGIYSMENKLLDCGVGLIDAIILMYGIKSKSKIWTLDKKFLRIIPEEIKYDEEMS